MKTALFVVLGFACFSQIALAQSASLQGHDAEEMIHALASAQIEPYQDTFVFKGYTASHVSCESWGFIPTIGPAHRMASCSLYDDTRPVAELKLAGPAADLLLGLLLKYGFGDAIGQVSSKAAAGKIDCRIARPRGIANHQVSMTCGLQKS